MKTSAKHLLLALFLFLAGCGHSSGPPPAQTQPQAGRETHYVASRKDKVFHRPECEAARRIHPENLESFATRELAVRAGDRPCLICRP